MAGIFTTAARWMLAALVALIAAGPLAAVASAAAPVETQQSGNRALERALDREKKNLATQRMRIEKAKVRADNVAGWIAKARERGKNTAALDAALGSFRASITTAEGSWAEAQAILTAAAGFDSAGKVTDAAAAKATVESAAAKLKQTRGTLVEAYKALRKAIAEWRKANRDIPDPKVPAEES